MYDEFRSQYKERLDEVKICSFVFEMIMQHLEGYKESGMILVQWKRLEMCVMCICERKERGEEKHKIDKRQNEVLKKKEMYINKENMINENVALQGVTTDLV